MAEVFISYASKDKGFALDLNAALQKLKRETWIDWRSTPDSAEWRAEIFAAIEASYNFLFIISPDSLHSWMCEQEVAHAVANRKRMVTILLREIGRELITLQGHSSAVRGLALSRDGKILISGGTDGLMQVYAMDIDLLMSLARTRVTRNLTPEECRKYLHRDECPAQSRE